MIGAEGFVEARDKLTAHLRAERERRLADGRPASVLVIGEWSGTPEQAARVLQLDLAVVSTAFSGPQAVRLIDAKRTFDLVWFVGDRIEQPVESAALFVAATILCAPAARLAALVSDVGAVFCASPWDRAELERCPLIAHTLIFATMSEKAARHWGAPA